MKVLILAAAVLTLYGCDSKKGESKSEVVVNEETGEKVRSMVIQFNDASLDGIQLGDSVVMKAQGLDADGNVVAFTDGKTESDVLISPMARHNVRDDNYYADLWRYELLKFQLPITATKWKIDFSQIPNRTCAPEPTEGAVADVKDVTTEDAKDGNRYTIYGNCKIKYSLSGTAKGVNGTLDIATSETSKKTITAAGEDVTFDISVDELAAVDSRNMTQAEMDEFSKKVTFGGGYNSDATFKNEKAELKIENPPEGQTCTITNGVKKLESVYQRNSGDNKVTYYYVGGPVFVRNFLSATTNDILIECKDEEEVPVEYSLSVNVTGLTSGTLKLRNNINLDPLDITANGSHTFAQTITANDGYDYDVRILAQPAGLTCALTNDVATAAADVTVTATCSASAPPSYTISGTVDDLPLGENVVLLLSYGMGMTETLQVDEIPIENPKAFTFMTALPASTAYTVTVMTDAASADCAVDSGGSVGDGSGTIGSANVTDIVVSCM